MAKVDRIWVQPTARGQLADRTWCDENSAPFEIEEGKFSKRWMKKLTAAEAKKAMARHRASGGVVVDDERVSELEAEVESLTAGLKAMTDERDKLAKDAMEAQAAKKPPSALAGDAKGSGS